MKHLPYGGSSAHRTLACPGWLKKSENLPPRPAGDAAVEGSMHHAVQERCQRDEVQPTQCLGHIYKEPGTDITREFTEDDLDLSEICLNATNALLDKLDIDELMVEPFVQLIPDVAGGSIDLLGLSADRKTIVDIDYKFGSAKVPVKESAQHGQYCISSRVDPSTKDMWSNVERVVFVIVQPRIKGVVFLWETDIAWLDKFEQTYRKAMTLTTINPGAHCKYCPAEPFCEEKRLNIMAANLLGARHQDELNAAAAMVVEVEDWAKSIKEEMYLQMVRGVPIKGWKIVEKRATRKWGDEDEAAKGIKLPKKDMFKTTLLSPAQMEKVIKRKKVSVDLNKFIVSVSPGMTIATDDDSREAVIVSDVQGELAEMMK